MFYCSIWRQPRACLYRCRDKLSNIKLLFNLYDFHIRDFHIVIVSIHTWIYVCMYFGNLCSYLILSLCMFISKVLMPIFIPRPLSNQKCFPNIKFAPNKYKLCNGWEFARSRQKSRYWILLLLQFHKRQNWFGTKNTKICIINN